MPVYNGENFIRAALDSLLAQTYPDFELIISDNGSTDGTAAICQAYAARDGRIRFFQQPHNLGAAANYNFVVAQAQGDWFKWAAHDDCCAPEFLARCVAILEGDSTVVVCYPRTTLIDDHGQVEGYYADGLHLLAAQPFQRYRQFFATQGLCHPVFGLIRLAVLRQTALIGNYHSSDRVLLGELALHGKFYEWPEPLFYRRIHAQISTKANPTDREFTAWFDPSLRGRLIFPRWRRLVEYVKGIRRAPLPLNERLLCLFQLFRYLFVPQRWQGLGGDLVKAMQQAVRNVFALVHSLSGSKSL